MALRNDIKTLVVHWKTLKDTLDHNSALFEIYEGNLLPYVLADLKAQLSQKSYDMVVHRVAPINILRRLIDKLSKIYSKPPVRNTEGGSDKDTVLLGDYVEQLDANTVMSNANEFFNLFKTTALEPYLDRGPRQGGRAEETPTRQAPSPLAGEGWDGGWAPQVPAGHGERET